MMTIVSEETLAWAGVAKGDAQIESGLDGWMCVSRCVCVSGCVRVCVVRVLDGVERGRG